MVQAHKTPGALVELHHDMFELEGYNNHYIHFRYLRGIVFEVLDCDGAHTWVVDRTNGYTFGLHSENFKTISKTKRLEYLKSLR